MVGTRLGVICETMALLLCGFLFGVFFSWQLTMIVAFMCILMLLIGYSNVHFGKILRKESSDILQGANTVRGRDELYSSPVFSVQFAVEFIHNIRTIKQLAVEKNILEKYSTSIHQASR